MAENRVMKVMLINSSIREHGCTDRALREVASVLEKDGFQADIVWLGKDPIADSLQPHEKDIADELLAKAGEYDGFVFGTPVYFGNLNGCLTSFLNRFFYGHANLFKGKIGAAVASCRRTGGITSVDEIYHWMGLNCMIIPTSCYWNEVHGNTPSEVEQDLEGLNTMRQLGAMISYLLKLKKLGEENGIAPEMMPVVLTNFIR